MRAAVAGSLDHPAAPPAADTWGLVGLCADRCIEIQAWGPFGQGRYTRPGTQPADAAAAAEVAAVAAKITVPAETVVLAWLLRLPWSVRPVVRTTRPERIAHYAAADRAAADMTAGQFCRLWTAARGEPLP